MLNSILSNWTAGRYLNRNRKLPIIQLKTRGESSLEVGHSWDGSRNPEDHQSAHLDSEDTCEGESSVGRDCIM